MGLFVVINFFCGYLWLVKVKDGVKFTLFRRKGPNRNFGSIDIQ